MWTDNLLAKRQRAAYRDTVGPGGSPMSPGMQPRNEQFLNLFSKANSNIVESAAILMEFAAAPVGLIRGSPRRERWPEGAIAA